MREPRHPMSVRTPPVESRRLALALYATATLALVLANKLRAESHRPPSLSARTVVGAGRSGETAVVRLDPRDAPANAIALNTALARVPVPGEGAPVGHAECEAAPRLIALKLDGRLSLVHFGAHAVCQLRELKRISATQPGAGPHGVGELAAFVLGRRARDEVQVSRVVVPPQRFTGETVTLLPADLGPLAPGERFIGTWHSHPDGDLEQGLLSFTDLVYMRTGRIDFHGAVGDLARAGAGADWLFDIVDPRDGDWNVYAHDKTRLRDLMMRCEFEAKCPLNELRLPGSRFYLQTRYYPDQAGVGRLFERIEASGGF